MEEILASIRRIISDDQENMRNSGTQHDHGTYRGGHEFSVYENPNSDAVRGLPPHGSDFDEGDDAGADELPPLPASPSHEIAAKQPDSKSAFTAAKPDESKAQTQNATEASALISDAVSASIFSAFERLEPDVRVGSPRTLEDVVADMLQPMLKNWIDDNLPALVERLIQAEIERITRGRR